MTEIDNNNMSHDKHVTLNSQSAHSVVSKCVDPSPRSLHYRRLVFVSQNQNGGLKAILHVDLSQSVSLGGLYGLEGDVHDLLLGLRDGVTVQELDGEATPVICFHGSRHCLQQSGGVLTCCTVIVTECYICTSYNQYGSFMNAFTSPAYSITIRVVNLLQTKHSSAVLGFTPLTTHSLLITNHLQ